MQNSKEYWANVQNDFVPDFFREIWKKDHGQDPVENEICYDANERRVFLWMLGTIFTIVIGALGILLLGSAKTYYFVWVSLVAFDVLLAVVCGFKFQHLSRQSIDSDMWHFRKYVESVQKLFQLFDIETTPEIGKMSKKQFKQAVEETLTEKAHMMDSSIGFAGMTGRMKWKEMHWETLSWGLCEEEYTKYWPRKADADAVPDRKPDIERG